MYPIFPSSTSSVRAATDAVGAEAAKRGFDGVPDVGAGTPSAVQVGLRPHLHAELGGQDDVVAMPLQGGAEKAFAVTAHATLFAEPAVHVGGVEQGDPGVEGGVDDGLRAVLVEAGAEVVAADADDGDGRAAFAQRAIPHDRSPNPMQTFFVCV
jgi:hypothetical protein